MKYPPYEFVVHVLLQGEYSFQLHVPLAQAASDHPKTMTRLVAITTKVRANRRRPLVRVVPSDANGSPLRRTESGGSPAGRVALRRWRKRSCAASYQRTHSSDVPRISRESGH